MFVSFFPRPRLFFISAAVWSLVLVILWFLGGSQLGGSLGLASAPGGEPIIGPSRFLTADFVWFYLYFAIGIGLFYLFWAWFEPHPWQNWSILGSGLIIFVTNFSVQVSVALNDWRGMFYDMVQQALTTAGSVTPGELYLGVWQFLSLALVGITVAVLNLFFVRHYVFRWRTAMNDYFVSYWPRLRHIEGASQRVQDDTMRFSCTMQGAGRQLHRFGHDADRVPAAARLAFDPCDSAAVGRRHPLSAGASPRSPGRCSAPCCWPWSASSCRGWSSRTSASRRPSARSWSSARTTPARAAPPTLSELFSNVRKNYFTLYMHYVYFDVVRYLYIQADVVFATMILVPTIAVGKITLGIFQQIVSAFTQVASSFQYLVNSWPTIVELISIYKRLGRSRRPSRARRCRCSTNAIWPGRAWSREA